MMNKLRVLDLFSGIGGFSLGLERTGGFETVAFCEIEEFPRKVLAKHWPDVPILENVKYVGRQTVKGPIDVICGGFPCQPFSTASAGRRVARDWWPEMREAIGHFMPQFVIAENTAELPIKRALVELRKFGYGGITKRIGAHEAGADHQRNRWWLCAYTDHQGELHSAINAEVEKLPQLCGGVWGAENYARTIRVSNGIPNRVDRNKCLGNAVLPQIPEAIGRAILATYDKKEGST